MFFSGYGKFIDTRIIVDLMFVFSNEEIGTLGQLFIFLPLEAIRKFVRQKNT